MPENQERYYNIEKLNKLFALAALLLMVALLFMVAEDYAAQWKDFQRAFRKIETEGTRLRLQSESQKLRNNAEYMDLIKKTADAKYFINAKNKEMAAIQAKIEKLRAKSDIANQKYQFAKAQYDSFKFTYEEAVKHQKTNVTSLKTKLDHLSFETTKLRLEVEGFDKSINEENGKLQSFTEEIRNYERSSKNLAKQVELLERKLAKIDSKRMTTANRIADKIRDLPVIDLANPNYKIKQIVLKDITDDVNFLRVPKVDRCITCHLGIDNPDFKDAPQPFRTHPNLEMFVAGNSAHPMEEFGCTTCHGGRGRGTDFVSSAHTPSSEAQAKEWEEKYHWHHLHLWQQPMLPKQYVEAGCFKCHANETPVKGAEKLSLGLNLIERAGCYGCHTIERYKNWPKVGPDLTKLPAKSNKDWVYRWINDPTTFRHNTWMPEFFHQSNNNDPESIARGEQEIHAMVDYLFKNSQEFKLSEVPSAGDSKRGEQLVATLGCFGCHDMAKESKGAALTPERLLREHGPNLIALGSKTSPKWIFNWLKDPNRYHPETKMPNLRLSDQEAADIAIYLSADKNLEFSKAAIPAVNEDILKGIVEELLKKTVPLQQAQEQAASMNRAQKLEFAGKKLIGQYGCFACHAIEGFEHEKPIGTELTEEGNKSAHGLDFGYIDIEHTPQAWFKQKLMNPRIFDQGKLKSADEKLKMPNYNFSEEEADAIVTALMGFVKDRPASSKMPKRTTEKAYIEEGQKLVRQLNCQGCHVMEGKGGAIQPKIKESLVKYSGKDENEAQALINSSSPPNLIGEGKKVHAEWLFEFLQNPTPIRPWLKVRMPTYHYQSAEQLNTLLKYFAALDKEPFPFADSENTSMTPDEAKAAEILFSNDYFGCAQCHIVGDKMPLGSADSWAPNFALSKKRLKPKWVFDWLKNPQDLLPGTKMPTYFDPKYFDTAGPEDILGGDETRQIKALRDYILTISTHPPVQNQTIKSEVTPAPADSSEKGTVVPSAKEILPESPKVESQAPGTAPASPEVKTEKPVTAPTSP